MAQPAYPKQRQTVVAPQTNADSSKRRILYRPLGRHCCHCCRTSGNTDYRPAFIGIGRIWNDSADLRRTIPTLWPMAALLAIPSPIKNSQAATEYQRTLKKATLATIVRRKILNQAFVADETGNDIAAKRLRALAAEVRSGDTGNREAQAAALYFQAVFGEKFTRNDNNAVNANLNYAYAVIRAAVARSLALYGWLPALGLFHKSELNPFNLADDFIEPLRPLADLTILNLKEQGRKVV